MLIQKPSDIRSSEITPESVYLGRRRFLREAGALAATGLVAGPQALAAGSGGPMQHGADRLNSWDEITGYNNFYEYSPDKRAVATLAKNFDISGWQIRIDGEVDKPRTLDLDQLRREFPVEERVYRMRCVEGWSMVIPWEGIPLAEIIRSAKPNLNARYVKFSSVHDPVRLFGQRRRTLAWPYTEGLTLAEAMHPLTLIATGIYGKPLPVQNGAPARLVVPWKYGFKSIKAIVSIRIEQHQPLTTWPQISTDYGFYANVNPNAAYHRGSQSRETRIGEMRKRETLLFNGYAEQVAYLYTGLDLEKHI